MPHDHEYDPTLQSPSERRSLLSQGVQRLRRLFVQVANITTLRTDTITERTDAAGVTIDTVLLKDGGGVFSDSLKITENDTTVKTDAEYIRGEATGGIMAIDVRDSFIVNIDTNNNTTGAGLIVRANANSADLFRVGELGTAFIRERGGAGGDIAAFGQIWVKLRTPNELFFTDDAGNDVKIGANGLDAHTNTFAPYKAVVEDPTSSEDIGMGFTNVAITITEIRAVLVGSSTPSVTWTIRHSTDRSATGNEVVTSGTTTTSTTTGDDVTSFNDATIPADSHIWLETTAKSGTVDELDITAIGTVD